MDSADPFVVHKALQRAMLAHRSAIEPIEQGLLYTNPYFRMTRTAFQFDTPGGARFRYDLDRELVLDCPNASLESECQLYQWGTVYGAMAWMRGLVPLHAGCIADHDRAIAITAASGTGKSTLAAALAQSGLRFLCDDTLVVCQKNDALFALPDGKPAKLTQELAQFLDLVPRAPVPFTTGKYYVECADRAASPIRLSDLILLEEGRELELTAVTGADKIELIGQSLYRGFIHEGLHTPAEHAQMMLGLAERLGCWKLVYPRRTAELRRAVATIRDRFGLAI